MSLVYAHSVYYLNQSGFCINPIKKGVFHRDMETVRFRVGSFQEFLIASFMNLQKISIKTQFDNIFDMGSLFLWKR
jgi:hypothetical protein